MLLQKKGGVQPPRIPPPPLGAGRGIKRVIDDGNQTAACHNLAAGEEPFFYTNQEGEDSGDIEHVYVDPYTDPRGRPGGRGSNAHPGLWRRKFPE